jgi:putative phosphoserine phosphatase / 1-acylglycerol-3-phosphate O-acyltransferase
MNTTTIKKLAIIDIDGTLINGQSQQKFIAHLRKKHYVGFFQYIVIMIWFLLYKARLIKETRNILSFALKIFKGKSRGEIASIVDIFVSEEIHDMYYKKTKDMLLKIKGLGYNIVLLSSAVEPIVSAIAKDLQVEEYLCTKLSHLNDNLDGKTEGIQTYGNEKLNKIQLFINNSAVAYSGTLVIADHYSDIPLLKWAEKSIVANPQPDMRKWATQNNVPVIYLDTDESIQYFESYIMSQ